MHRNIVLGLLVLATVIWGTANGAEVWAISAQHPCTGLTVGFARPMADLSDLVGPHWQPAPGPVAGQGLVLLFITSCPDSSYAGKPTGTFSGAFVLIPVVELQAAGAQTHAIAVLRAAGQASTPVMKTFRSHGIPISEAHVSLDMHNGADGKHAEVVIHFTQGTLILNAELQPSTQAYKSLNTVAVRVTPANVLFSGPESSTRYAKGKADAHASGQTWLERYQLGTPLFVTLDTDFIWNFEFGKAQHP